MNNELTSSSSTTALTQFETNSVIKPLASMAGFFSKETYGQVNNNKIISKNTFVYIVLNI